MTISATVRPVEIDGRFWVHTTIDGQELQPRGPYSGIDEANAATRQIAGVCQAIFHGGVMVAPPQYWQEARCG